MPGPIIKIILVNNLYRHTLSILQKGEKRRFYRLIALDVFITLLDLAFLALLLFVVGYYTNTIQTDKIPGNIRELIKGHPLILIGAFLLLFALKNLFGFIIFRMQFKYVYDVASRLSEENLRDYLDGSYADFVEIDSSIHIRRISQQTIEFSHHVLRGMQLIISNAILIVLTITAIIIFDAVLFGLLFFMLLPAVILIVVLTKAKLVSIRQSAKSHRERSIQYLNEALSGFIETNIYQAKEFFIDRYSKFQGKFNAGLARQLVMQNLPARMMEVFAVLGLFLLIVINTYIIESDSLLLWVGAFMAAAYKIIPGIVRILNNLQQVRIFSYTVDDLVKAKRFTPRQIIQADTPISSIKFSNIGFSYKNQEHLKNISFIIQTGNFTGLSGISGRGKTTILNLLLGFLEPSTGTISINDHQTTAEERKSYWSKISYCRQQPFVIHDSIQHNISLSDKPDMERLWAAVNATGLAGLISGSEKGLDTIISENGKNISGGQRQRIALARALYRDADLYLLDEPFNELDQEASAKLLSHLKWLSDKGKIILLVTHDKSALQYCSQIIRLDEI